MDERKREEEEEISLIDLFAVVWRRRVMVVVITLAAAAVSVGVSVVSLALPAEESPLPNQYTPEALMLINDSRSSGGSLSSALSSSGLSSLASLAGLSLGGGQKYSDLAQYLIGTNTFLDAVTDRFGLIERYKIKRDKSPRAASRRVLKKVLLAEYEDASGVLSIGFSDIDPAFAREVVNFSVDYLERWFQELGLDKDVLQKENLEQNIEQTFRDIRGLEEESRELERRVSGVGAGGVPLIVLEARRIQLELTAKQEIYRQLRVQLELVNVSLASESPIFQVLERAEEPDQKSKPSRGLLCMIVTGGAFFLGVFGAFALNALENIRNDPEAMAKLRAPEKGKDRGV